MADDYYKRPEWSYSSMKKILDSGIDYAVAAKQGMLGEPSSSAIDLGQLVHMLVLGGEDTFAVCDYPDFRTKLARDWRDGQIAAGKNIITRDQFEAATQIVGNIENHIFSEEYLLGDGWKHEIEMYATTAEGIRLRGKADALKIKDGRLKISDLKTTSKFDKFLKNAPWRHYDLQAANYTLIGCSSQSIKPEYCDYYFCVAETVVPYRVQFFYATPEFVESGERKLRTCIDSIISFGDSTPNFLIPEMGLLGDWSL